MKAIAIGVVMAMAMSGVSTSVAAAAEPNAALKQLIADANKEGRIELQWGAGNMGGSEGGASFEKAMNQKFGTDIRIRWTPGPSQPEVASAVIVSNAAGQAPPTDAYLGTTSYLVLLSGKNVLKTVDWHGLMPERIDPGMVEANGAAVRIFTTLPGGIIYNVNLAPKPPTSLADLLKPEWKGKLASTPYAASFDLLGADDVWGRERTLDYARALSQQIAGVIRCTDGERVASGEFVAFAMDCTGRDWVTYQKKGAPINHVVPSDFAAQRYYYLGIPKNSVHPNAATLFALFVLTPEGQSIMWTLDHFDLHSFPDSGMHGVVQAYVDRGMKFKEFSIDWARKHPDIDAVETEAAKILTKR